MILKRIAYSSDRELTMQRGAVTLTFYVCPIKLTGTVGVGFGVVGSLSR
jgi:hypothetical protein